MTFLCRRPNPGGFNDPKRALHSDSYGCPSPLRKLIRGENTAALVPLNHAGAAATMHKPAAFTVDPSASRAQTSSCPTMLNN